MVSTNLYISVSQNASISVLIKPIGLNNVEGVRTFFCAIMVPQSPIGLISAEIGALCRILGHATLHVVIPGEEADFSSCHHFWYSLIILSAFQLE